jgi:hypothetical protein
MTDEAEHLHWKVIFDPLEFGSICGLLMSNLELSCMLCYASFTVGSRVKHRQHGTFTVYSDESPKPPHINRRGQPQILRNGTYQVRSNGSDGHIVIERLDELETYQVKKRKYHADYQREYRERNRERLLAKHHAYYQANRENMIEDARERRKKRSEAVMELEK